TRPRRRLPCPCETCGENSFVRDARQGAWCGYPDPFVMNDCDLSLGGHGLAHVLVQRGQEVLGVQEGLVLADEQGEVLGHLAALDGPYADLHEGAGEGGDLG